jgi:tetratricopeptide (TPR) repeat protein
MRELFQVKPRYGLRLKKALLLGQFVAMATVSSLSLGAHESPSAAPIIQLIPGLGSLHHPVSTKHLRAQRFFNQGLTLIYAFNHDAAYRSFQRAAELDPQLAMAYWGMALALGSNINKEITSDEEYKAYDLAQKALTLSSKATKQERACIEALTKRYSNERHFDDKKLNLAYSNAMRNVVREYPDDLDAATLFAESLMNLNPWKQWTLEGSPNAGTLEAVHTLESTLRRDPQHIGANHYYIHVMEGSTKPEYALMSARRLPALAPAAGHLIHMPSHIYYLLGDYQAAVDSNLKAIRADRAYIQEYGMSGTYPAHYLGHNFDMLTRAYSMQGRFKEAKRTADELAGFYAPYYTSMPELEFRMLIPTLFVLQRFRRWEEILDLSKPPVEMAITTAMWRAARGMAYAALGDVTKALRERQYFLEMLKKIPAEATFGLNSAHKIFEIEDNLLEAKIAQAEEDNEQVRHFLERAVAEEDSTAYDDPPDWYYPIRESLGGQLLRERRYQEAEQVFRKSLDKFPRNGRALFGLLESLKRQNKGREELFWVQRAYERAWRQADAPLTVDDL